MVLIDGEGHGAAVEKRKNTYAVRRNPSSVLLETLRNSEQFLHIAVNNEPSQGVAAW